MSPFLFAYGTLQPGLAPPEIAPLMDGIPVIASGSVPGILYDLGGYPGALPDPRAESRIYGVIYQLPEDPAALAQLDAYEFDPGAPAASRFLRQRHPVQLQNGRTLPCWVYVLSRAPAGAPILKSGVFPAG